MNRDAKPLRIWCLLRDQFAHTKPLEKAFKPCADFYYDSEWDPRNLEREKPDVVICVNDYHYDIARCLERAGLLGIPSLTLQDGILEWRCQYENPLFGAGGGAPQHQPVLADKIACLGNQSARQIAAWGNAQKVEITGMPRLDYLLSSDFPATRKPGNRVLIMTAKNPGFTAEQHEITVRSLKDLKKCLEARKELTVTWRISPKVVEELGVENQYRQAASQELTALLKETDAVITTPSTAILEAMLLKRPVAVLDYHNVPRFLPTAWTVSAPQHLDAVIDELLDPSPRKLAFQQDCLNDSLFCSGPAAPRIARLLREMVRLAQEAKKQGSPLRLPANMVASEVSQMPNRPAPLSDLYPEHPIFGETNVASLQLKLARLESENVRLKEQVAGLQSRLNSSRLANLVRRAWQGLRHSPAWRVNP
jgi:hypothetical protein